MVDTDALEGAEAPASLPTHPGVFLRDVVLPEVELSKTEIAARLGLARPTFYAILNGEGGVTPETALKLGRLFGNSAKFWMNMQMAYDLARAKAAISDQLEAIVSVANRGSAAVARKVGPAAARSDAGKFLKPGGKGARVAGSDLAQSKRGSAHVAKLAVGRALAQARKADPVHRTVNASELTSRPKPKR
jgi:addiction module HigA family antidote